MKSVLFFAVTFLMGVSTGMMTGGWSEVKDLNAPEIQKYAKLATETLTAEMDTAYHLKMTNITKAQKQVVSGMNYKINMVIVPSECPKSGNYTKEQIEACPPQKCETPMTCTAKVWVRVWHKEDPIKVSDTVCDPHSC